MTTHPIPRLAWRNVRRYWRHSLGSLLSIVVGFVAMVLFEGYLHDLVGIQAQWYTQRSMMGHVMIERRDASARGGREGTFEHPLRREEQAFVEAWLNERAGEVVARMRALALGGLASAGRSGQMFLGWAYDVEDAARLRGPWAWNVSYGVPLHEAPPDSVLVGNTFAELLDCRIGHLRDPVDRRGLPIVARRPFACERDRLQLTATTESGQLNAIEPIIVGTFNAGLKDIDAKFVHLPLALGQRLLDTDVVSFYSVALRHPARAERFARELTEAAEARGVEVEALPWQRHRYAEIYRRSMEVLGIYRSFVVLIVVAIAGMSVFSTMLKAVNERVREIGTLRSLGYRRGHVAMLFTLEAVLLAAVGSAVGLAVAVGMAALVNAAGISYRAGMAAQAIPLTMSVRPRACIVAVLFLSAVTVVAAWSPARRAARLRIADALAHAA